MRLMSASSVKYNTVPYPDFAFNDVSLTDKRDAQYERRTAKAPLTFCSDAAKASAGTILRRDSNTIDQSFLCLENEIIFSMSIHNRAQGSLLVS